MNEAEHKKIEMVGERFRMLHLDTFSLFAKETGLTHPYLIAVHCLQEWLPEEYAKIESDIQEEWEKWKEENEGFHMTDGDYLKRGRKLSKLLKILF